MIVRRKESFGIQVECVNNTTMPSDLIPDKATFVRAGFKFGKKYGQEDVDVQIPDGWSRRTTGAYRVNIYDRHGRLRAEVRRHTARLLPRYRVARETDLPGVVTWTVLDGGTVLYRASCRSLDYETQDEQFSEAKKWLRENYSRAEDPLAYW